ncbi:hypothetical protein [Psychromonas ossibalaenae]|uniref:hypothetical protein n=1 Tax=Psychromonas ossibalaenae TaxID=444922 RepID=UPI0003693493|nr:hypothetical protein [Psychromonas ossibalaenae]
MSLNQYQLTAGQWESFVIQPQTYCNTEALNGFQTNQSAKGNPLHPDLQSEKDFEQSLEQSFQISQQQLSVLKFKRVHMLMPAVNADRLPGVQDYQPTAHPLPLKSTSVSAVWFDQEDIHRSAIGYHYKNSQLATLKERLAEQKPFKGICGNLGYFMTRELNCGDHIWSHSRRFADQEFQLPEVLSYLGFYFFNKAHGERGSCGFQGVHRGALAVTAAGSVEILPEIEIQAYDLEIGSAALTVDIINPDFNSLDQHDIVLFNSACQLEHEGALQEFSPMLPVHNRVNLFISSRGDGSQPHEEVIKVWHGRAPLPSFGVVISIKEALFNELFADRKLSGLRVDVRPYSDNCDFSRYRQILGGLVPAVIDGEPVVPTGEKLSSADAERGLHKAAGTLSPLARTGRESNNFDALIREPAGLIIQTERSIGWLLFDGRHELSIGANIVDSSNLLVRLQELDIDIFDGEKITAALFIDGGSAMKVYALTQSEQGTDMTILNRVAAGGRNGPGNDQQGLNLYSTAVFEFPPLE